MTPGAGGYTSTVCISALSRGVGREYRRDSAGYYPGEYLIETGKKLVEKYDTKLLEMQESERLETIHDEVIKDMMASIKLIWDGLGLGWIGFHLSVN